MNLRHERVNTQHYPTYQVVFSLPVEGPIHQPANINYGPPLRLALCRIVKQRQYAQETLGLCGDTANTYEVVRKRTRSVVQTQLGNLWVAKNSGVGVVRKGSKMRREGCHEQDPEGRAATGQERGRLKHLAPVFRTLSSSFVGIWCKAFDPVVSSQPCKTCLSWDLFWGWLSFWACFPSVAQDIPGTILF